MSVTGQPDSVAEKSIYAQLGRTIDMLSRSTGLIKGIRVRVKASDAQVAQSPPPEQAPPDDTIADRVNVAEGIAAQMEPTLNAICDRLG